eukprot:GHVS01011459.1.p1 GENE.GHVS01011459.1~~GHVS01011459.1.p1  ORF type:complete len:351 (+),score=62.33 GHVS01011459.1:123-1175(+)
MAAVEGLPHRSSLEGSSDVGHPMPQGQPPPVRKFFRRLSLMVTAPQLQDGAPVPDCEILSTPKASDGLGIPPALPSRPSARRSASLDIGSTEHQLNFHPSDGLVKQCEKTLTGEERREACAEVASCLPALDYLKLSGLVHVDYSNCKCYCASCCAAQNLCHQSLLKYHITTPPSNCPNSHPSESQPAATTTRGCQGRSDCPSETECDEEVGRQLRAGYIGIPYSWCYFPLTYTDGGQTTTQLSEREGWELCYHGTTLSAVKDICEGGRLRGTDEARIRSRPHHVSHFHGRSNSRSRPNNDSSNQDNSSGRNAATAGSAMNRFYFATPSAKYAGFVAYATPFQVEEFVTDE